MLRVFVLVLAAQCLLTAAQEDILNAEDIKRICQQEHQLDAEAISLLNKTLILETTDQRMQCFVKCVLKHFKVMNDEGDILVDEVRSRNPKWLPHFEKCRNMTGTDSCDKAVNFQNCLLQSAEVEEQPPE